MQSLHGVLVTGVSGQLGSFVRHRLGCAGYRVVGLGRRAGLGIDVIADIADLDDLNSALAEVRVSAIIHCAAYTDVDGCERSPWLADNINRQGAENIARFAESRNVWMVGVSTDYVFSGDAGAPYTEDGAPSPVSVYGRSKLDGETAIEHVNSGFAIARTSWLYGGSGKHFPRTILSVVSRHGEMEVVDDEYGSPTFAGDVARSLVALLDPKPSGIFHLVNSGSVSRYDLARAVATYAGIKPDVISATSTSEFLRRYPLPAKRPRNSALINVRASAMGISLPAWEASLAPYTHTLAQEFPELSRDSIRKEVS